MADLMVLYRLRPVQLHMFRSSDGTVHHDPNLGEQKAFPYVKDLVALNRSAFDRIIQAGGYAL